MQTQIGDRGQRYEVVQVYEKDGSIVSLVWGWTNEQDGGKLADSCQMHPQTLAVRVTDRGEHSEGSGVMDTKTFPIQTDYRETKAHPTRIPWEVADKAYAVYRSRYGSQQSLERLAERGGFSGGEMDMFYPGWRDEVSGIAVRDARITALETALAAMTKERDEMDNRVHIARTTIRNYQNIARELKDERDARDVAIRVLADECREWRKIKWTPDAFSRSACVYRRLGADDALDMTARATEANPIARAAVEGG